MMASCSCCYDDARATNPSSSRRRDFYLTSAPRGLESFVISNIKSQLISNGYTSFWISEIGPSPLTRLHGAQPDVEANEAGEMLSDRLLDEIAAKIEHNKYKKKIKKRKKNARNASDEPDGQRQPKPMSYAEFISNNPDLSKITGSVDVSAVDSHVSVGYHTLQNEIKKILTVPGTLEGIVNVAFATDAPPVFVASMPGMGCGPLLALVTSSCLMMPVSNDCDPTVVDGGRLFQYDYSLDQARSAIEKFFKSNEAYTNQFKSALHLWYRHTREVWHVPDSIYGDYKDQEKVKSETLNTEPIQQISYRLSCTRSHSKKYAHRREDLVSHLAELIIPMGKIENTDLVPSQALQRDKTPLGNNKATQRISWIVNLKDYDVEIVSMIHYGCLTVAIPLRPYQLWGSRSYRSNTIPCDGSSSFGRLGPKRSLSRFVHLRPSTADILINIANLPPHSVVLDPCAGIGTINIRASHQNHYGLGGEIVPSLFEKHAPYFLDCNTKFQHSLRRGAVDMNGWDATMLPLRDSFVNAVISDIPFGQKCLTHNELHAFLSGFVYECSRVLVKNNGKMVLLCGDCEIVHSTLEGLNERSMRNNATETVVFKLPCESVFPVNISGILAWVIVVERGCGKPVPSTNYRIRTKPKHRISYLRK